MSAPQTVTILFTDMVGSTDLASRVGGEAADAIRRTHFGFLREAVARAHGEEIKTTGDGLMLVFRSATQAIDCAVEMQQVIDTCRHDEPEHPELRVGLSTGEASFEEQDWFGAPVVEAARLVAAAEPGQILVGSVSHTVASGRGTHRFQALAPLVLKGIPEPYATWDVEWRVAARRRLRVLLADDSVLLREGMARMLTAAGIDVIGQAGDVGELRALLANDGPPDVVITDIRMPPTHTDEGIRAALEIRAEYPNIGILVLSQYLETAYAVRLLSDGSRGMGYLLKDRVARADELPDAVRRVAAGESVVDPEVVNRLVSKHRDGGPLAAITERERDVLALMAEGRSNQAICERLTLSPKTLESHVRSIFTKLDILAEPNDHRRVLAVLTYLRQAQ
jgi:DNA-binding NarL/FixJ family response regulator/class 3 adenylate cyclase